MEKEKAREKERKVREKHKNQKIRKVREYPCKLTKFNL